MLGWILGPMAIIFAGRARRDIAAGRAGGASFATAGKTIGIIGTILGIAGTGMIMIWSFIVLPMMFKAISSSLSHKEETTLGNMEDIADALDKYHSKHDNFPEDTVIYSGEFSNEVLWQKLKEEMPSLVRKDLRDGWGHLVVYDRLVEQDRKREINKSFGYDKSILDDTSSDKPPAFFLWSKGEDEDDPTDDIYFIEGLGIIRPPGAKCPD